jgi:DNA-binding MarR family transcriptional regulator
MQTTELDVDRAAADLRACLGPLVRRLRAVHGDGELTLSQVSVLVRLERDGAATPGALAAAEAITAQSMGAIVAALADRGLVRRDPDPADGRRVIVSLSPAGRRSLSGVRQEKARRLARAIRGGLDTDEQVQLIAAIPLLERLGRLV